MISIKQIGDGLSKIDRRVLYLVMSIAVVLPLFFSTVYRVTPSQTTLQFDNALASAIESGKPIVIDVDFGPQTMAELEPILYGVMHRVFSAKAKAIFMTLSPDATAPTRRYLSEMEKQYNLKYGVDYVFLGYASSFAYTMYGMGSDIRKYFHEDDRGASLDEIPLMKGVKSLKDTACVLNVASNSLPVFWVQYAVAPHEIDLLVGCTAVYATDYYPYLQTGQMKGILAGGRAGAEYETLLIQKKVLSQTGDATRALGSQSMAMFAILVFILIGNVSYFLNKKRGRS